MENDENLCKGNKKKLRNPPNGKHYWERVSSYNTITWCFIETHCRFTYNNELYKVSNSVGSAF